MSKILLNKKKTNYSKYFQKISIVAVAAIILATIAIYITLTQSGSWLVNDDEFDHVKWLVILDGQSANMERSDFAAELVAKGKADSVLILGRRVYRDRSNAEFYADDFLKHSNLDSAAIFLARHDDASTLSEAYTIIPWLKNRNADSVLLITTAAATKRVSKIFKTLAGKSPVFLTTDIHHHLYDANTWYINRESRKNWLREWTALFYSKMELTGLDTLTASDSIYYAPIRSLVEEKQNNSIVDLHKVNKPLPKATYADIAKDEESSKKDAKAETADSDSQSSKAEAKKDEKTEKSTESSKNESKKNDKKNSKSSSKKDSKKNSSKK